MLLWGESTREGHGRGGETNGRGDSSSIWGPMEIKGSLNYGGTPSNGEKQETGKNMEGLVWRRENLGGVQTLSV